jgi:MFS family permease
MAAREQTAGIWDRGQRSLTVGLLLTVSMAAFEALAVATILPVTVRELGRLQWYGWVFSGFMLTSLVSITVAGDLTDRYGPARPFAYGSGLFALGLAIAGLAPSMAVVVLGRVVQGGGAGAISSVSYVAVARAYRSDAQPRMLAMLSSAWVVPGLIGPALAGTVADALGWRWVFLGLAPLTAVAASLALPGLRRLGPAAGESVAPGRIRAAVSLAAGTGIVLLGAESQSFGSATLLLAIGVAIGFPALRRLMPAGTLRARPGLPAAIATLALLSFAFFGAEAFLPLSLTAVRGQPATIAGLALTAGTLAWSAGAWAQARLASRSDGRALVRTGLALTLAGIAGAMSVLAAATPVIVAAVSWGAAGLGIGLAYSAITLIVLKHAPAGQEGAAASALQLANVLGVALGTGLGGAALALAMGAGQSQASGLTLVDAIMIAAAGLGLAAAGRLSARQAENARAASVTLCATKV